jgi:UPF0755 protein
MDTDTTRQRKPIHVFILACACVFVIIAGLILSEMRSPADFTSNTIVHVEKNMTLVAVANELYTEHVIRSPLLFRVTVTVLGRRRGVGAGDYLFAGSENTWQVATRLVNSDQGFQPIRVTFPEGLTVMQMGAVLNAAFTSTSSGSTTSTISTNISQFNQKTFLSLASTSEGYLFPDTYLFLPNASAATVVSVMKNNFNQKIASIQSQIAAFPSSPSAIVTMASIVEKEATSSADRRIIAGILWKRLSAGQLLQIDPPLVYAENQSGGKPVKNGELTLIDLATSSPYNTYKYKGLPPGPIDNPGLDALTDTVTPTTTNYWFYLSDKNGVIHYAATYEDHLANIAKYLTN